MSVSPPRPKMPQLNALRAFEAAARHNSISAAAAELCVTPAAVAQQVKSLEAWAGDELFRRNPKGVELTPLGSSVLSDFSAAFDALAMAVQKLRINANPSEVRIAALPSIAQLWVSPRLPRIRRALPEISVSVTAVENPPNLDREPFDLAIFYSDFDNSDSSDRIEQDSIFPVCSPAIAARVKSVSDLRHETFLHDTTWDNDWQTWLAKASPNQNLNKSGPEFSLYSLALEECKNGAGILIGHEALVRSQLDAGNLIAPIPISVDLPRYITFKARKQTEENPFFSSVFDMLKSGK